MSTGTIPAWGPCPRQSIMTSPRASALKLGVAAMSLAATTLAAPDPQAAAPPPPRAPEPWAPTSPAQPVAAPPAQAPAAAAPTEALPPPAPASSTPAPAPPRTEAPPPGATSSSQRVNLETTDPDEDGDHGAQNVEGAGAFLIGTGLFDFSSLDDRFTANGYEDLPKLPLLIGGEGRAIFQSGFVVGARGMALLFPRRSGPDGAEAQVAGGFGLVDVGFALVHSRSFLFTLTGGVGGFGLNVDIDDRRSADFDDVLADPRRSASMSHGGLLGGLTLGFDGRVPIGGASRKHRSFFTMGLRVTGLFGPSLGEDWALDSGATARNGPDTGLTGGFAALALGFGGGRRDDGGAGD